MIYLNDHTKIFLSVFLTIAFFFSASLPLFAKDSDSKKDKPEEKKSYPSQVRIFAGYGSYSMKDFNNKLERENNDKINGGLNAGLEVDFIDISKLSLLSKIPLPSITLPLGVEYLGANSKTRHNAAGGSATVEWDIPVIGIYVSPTIHFDCSTWCFYLRPIGIGYYSLGRIIDAELTVSDRSGRLTVKGEAVGVTSLGGMNVYLNENFSLFIEGGYRFLKFNSIAQNQKGGFTATPGGAVISSGNLASELDYSGFIFRSGITFDIPS